MADQDRMIQIFLNLMHNAVAHTRTGDVIALGGGWDQVDPKAAAQPSVAPDGGVVRRRLRLWVRDEGEGMSDEVRQRLFEPFYRGSDHGLDGEAGGSLDVTTGEDDATSGAAMEQHLGLGLAIVAALVRAHEGRMEVRSTLGSGSCFTVYLPG